MMTYAYIPELAILVYLILAVYFIFLATRFVKAVEKIADKFEAK